jgi:LEA14-like dessication related protein
MRKHLFFLLAIAFFSACKSQPQIIEEPTPETVIEVIEPVFEIVSIFVIQADLVNTQFETVLKVNNPNRFALYLSSIKYQLYGNGSFWSDGSGNDVLYIPPRSSKETNFRFSMNFINMNRRLLDDVIAMRKIRYRFRGEAEIQPDVPRLPPFTINFDCTGFSDVKQRAE